MDLNTSSPVITDSVPVSNSRLGIPSSSMSYSTSSVGYSSPSLSLVAPRRKFLHGKLDNVCVSTWVDAMRCSSPPRKKLNIYFGPGSALDETDPVYLTWMTRFPSALSSFEEISSSAIGKQIALFLDYDGTLSPIVDNPDNAFMSDAMRATVKSVARYFPTAIVSGRSCDKIFGFVKLTEVHYAGSHGMDIMCPLRKSESLFDLPNSTSSTDKKVKDLNLFQPAREFLPMIDEVFRRLIENTRGIDGARVEDNKFCISVHYRNVDEKDWNLVAHCVSDVLKDYPRLRLTHGRKVLEVRPVIDWNKGNAVEFLLESLGLSHCDEVLPIYVGDDRTDEDAFKVLREGNRGYGILVSSAPKETAAFYTLRDPSEVLEFLKSLVRWKYKR